MACGIELRQADENWTPNAAVHPLGEDNDLTVTRYRRFHHRLRQRHAGVSVTDATLDAGKIGIYFATDDGEATVTLESYRVYASVPSMTGPSLIIATQPSRA